MVGARRSVPTAAHASQNMCTNIIFGFQSNQDTIMFEDDGKPIFAVHPHRTNDQLRLRVC